MPVPRSRLNMRLPLCELGAIGIYNVIISFERSVAHIVNVTLTGKGLEADTQNQKSDDHNRG
jgi:hypothetical protein